MTLTATPGSVPLSWLLKRKKCRGKHQARHSARHRELPGVNYEEISFEGYGPGGVAVIVDVTTDNRNRTVSEIRHTFGKHGGNLGETGSVRFMFSKKGIIAVDKPAATEEQLMDIVLEHGGEDLNDEGDTWEIITDPASYDAVLAAVKAAGIPVAMSEVTMLASTYTKLEGAAANQMIRCLKPLKTTTTRKTSIPISIWTRSKWSKWLARFYGKLSDRPPACGGLFLREPSLQILETKKGRVLTRTAKLFMFVFMAGALVEGSLLVSAQTSGDAAGTGVHPRHR